jgi:hypothetical protein
MLHIVQSYPDAQFISVVIYNLKTQKVASLYEAFPPEQARAIERKLEFHYTPKIEAGPTWLKSNWLFYPTCA